jgi:type VI secretion system protein ImpA
VIIDFLTRTEPSSPIIFVLRRAQRMVGMDFLQVIQELSLGGTDVRETLKPAMGIGLPDPAVAEGASNTSGT